MVQISALIGLPPEKLVVLAWENLACGDIRAARIAARMAALSGGDCPFDDPDLRDAWACAAAPTSRRAVRSFRHPERRRSFAAQASLALDGDGFS